MRMAFAKFVGWWDKPRNQNEIPCDGLNFSNYTYQVDKLSTGGWVEKDIVVTWRKMVKV